MITLRANRNQTLNFIKRYRANSWHIHNVLDVLEWSMLLTISYDALCSHRANAWKSIQLFKGCSIDINQAGG